MGVVKILLIDHAKKIYSQINKTFLYIVGT